MSDESEREVKEEEREEIEDENHELEDAVQDEEEEKEKEEKEPRGVMISEHPLESFFRTDSGVGTDVRRLSLDKNFNN